MITCSSCNNLFLENLAGSLCPTCGSSAKTIHVEIIEKVNARDGVGMKAKRPGERRPYIEDLSIPEHSHSLEKIVHRARIIDRDKDRYFEKITDYETGEIIHHCEEPLSQHQGHGSAKKKSE
ncbi:hypothetical protein [Polynucleobacter sp. AP-Nino-20-G2]|uniref:hypothetical protein n=1 Tax=Polynucleobacter sp. AP-Nino-20-G2 TaxID=2576917 RepID=UPI001BFDB973|nr:hypothetical protein [Polynucleobacter sp. AP-Nino-20-G2]QWE17165.1 hypothetical protein FD960_02790 [Polynucleobacter sp. AP-Nino-20-G2]